MWFVSPFYRRRNKGLEWHAQGLPVTESIRTKAPSLRRVGLSPVTLGAPQNGAVSVALLLFLTRAAGLLAPWTEVLGPRLIQSFQEEKVSVEDKSPFQWK